MKMTVNPGMPRRPRSSAASAGFTIVEMMVAMTVSLFIVGALLAVVMGSSSAGRTRERASELQVNGRYAVEQIKSTMLHSGFLGVTGYFDTVDTSFAIKGIAVANVCDAANTGNVSQRIWGSNDANPYAATCIPAVNYARGDVVMVRYLNPTAVVAPFSTTLAYYYSSYDGGEPFKGPAAPAFAAPSRNPPYFAYRVEETVYYISPFTTSAAENPLVPALYRLVLGDGPAMVPELVASGVENMQLRFGQFQTDETIRYLEASAITNWDLVRSVQVWLLMRAATPEPEYANNSTYTMGDQNIVVNDSFRRLLLSTVVQLRN